MKHKQNEFVLMPAELSLEAASKRAEEQLAENFGTFKNMNRFCTEQELERLKIRWIEKQAINLQIQYKAMVKAVGRTP